MFIVVYKRKEKKKEDDSQIQAGKKEKECEKLCEIKNVAKKHKN